MSTNNERQSSDYKSLEDFVVEGKTIEIDPYNEALNNNLGDLILQHEQLKEVLKRLNPRDYLDWDGSDFQKSFDDPESSSS